MDCSIAPSACGTREAQARLARTVSTGTAAAHPFIVSLMALLRGGVGPLADAEGGGARVFESAWFGAGDGALPSWDPAHDGLVRGLMANVRGMARDGLACGRLGRTEHALTAALSAYIQQYLALRGATHVQVVHQAPDGRDGKIDIAACVMEPYADRTAVGGPRVVVVGEGAVDLTNKRGQLTSYVLRTDKCLDRARHEDPIVLGFIVNGLGTVSQVLEVVAYYKTADAKYGRAVLLPQTLAEAVVWKRFLLALEFFVKCVGSVRAACRGTPYWPAHANAVRMPARAGGAPACILKVFDYAEREAAAVAPPPCARRRGAASHELAGFAEVLKADGLSVIKLDVLPGHHCMSRIEHGVFLINALLAFWGDVDGDPRIHSDIRLSNLLFDDTCCAIIDRDYAGRRSEEREYPANWNREIRDGARHAGAVAHARHALEHDAFAAAAVMKLHEAGAADAQCAWVRATGLVEIGQPADARDALSAFGAAELSLVGVPGLPAWGTGSPPKM